LVCGGSISQCSALCTMSRTVCAILLLIVSICCAAPGVVDVTSGRVRYDGQAILRVHANSTVDALKLAKLRDALNLDVWSHSGNIVVGSNDIRMTREEAEALESLPHEVLIKNVQDLIDTELASLSNVSRAADFYAAYQTYDTIVSYLSTLAGQYPSLAKFVASIGQTIQGRDIPAITIGSASASKKVFFSGGQHAREWIGPVTVVYIVENLLINYATDPQVKNILDNIQFVVVPLMNGDGYNYAWTTDRLWRKNRRQNTGSSYYGVDLNRNWNDHWGGQGSSPNPSSDTYRGTAAFSEPEAKAVSAYYLSEAPFAAAIDWHSYSQLILRPHGWTSSPPAEEAYIQAVGDEIRNQILAVNGKSYISEGAWELYYTTGSASDWFYGEGETVLAFTIELRDTGTYGFVLPTNQIIPTGKENYAAVVFLGNFLLEEKK